MYLRQTFGLAGEQETIESTYGQMADKKDVWRVTVQVGKFSDHDVFDNNAYAQDPRTQTCRAYVSARWPITWLVIRPA
jgi:high affinity Mn2+ porin